MEDLKEVPCQAQIHYTSISGHKLMRVITSLQKLTQDRNVAESKADVRMIHSRAAQKSTELVQQGRFQEANNYNRAWAGYMENNSNYKSSALNQELVGKQRNFRKANVKKNLGFKEKMAGLFSFKDKAPAKVEKQAEQEENLSDLDASDDECEEVLHRYKKGL